STMEALMTVPAERPDDDDIVAGVFQKGYLFKETLIRPARARVRKYEPETERRPMASATTKADYQTRGVSESATAGALKKAYRRLAKQYHPDANPNDAAAAERFKEVGEAYAVLSDPEKRAHYDRVRRMGPFSGFGAGAGNAAGGAGGFRFTMDDLGDLGG